MSNKTNTRIKFISEPDIDDNVSNIKNLTGNDTNMLREIKPIQIKPIQIKPSYKLIFPENNPYEKIENLITKSRKTHEVKNELFGFNNPMLIDEYNQIIKLFDCNKNILNFSDSEYSVIWIKETKLYYVLETSSKKLFCCDYEDIFHIHFDVYGMPLSLAIIESICFNKNNIKYNLKKTNYIEEKLNLNLFKAFIQSNFDIVNTIILNKYF
jgi:hypothetical protein